MKKLLDSKFLFILALSVLVLIVLGVGAFYLFDDSDAVFVKDGYVLNPLSAKSEKYFFDENTSYKENLSQMVVFDDTDKNEAKVTKDSFLHYMDGSLSFLKNGAILDLNSIKGNDAVKFYNITNKSIVEKSGNGYVIETNGSNIELNNFIGRISDNKYIVAGKLEAKIPGNEKNISADYFEIVYTTEGVINIENKDVKYQVTAEGTYIYAGDITIDLGNKKITKGDSDVMSITAITINGDENIEIIPKAEEKEDENTGNGNDGNNQIDDNSNNQDGNDGNTDGNQTANNDNAEIVKRNELQVTLKDARIGSTSVSVSFDLENAREDDSLTLSVTNLETGRTINKYGDIQADEEIRVNFLSPNSKYLFTVVNERDESKYFQKVFETSDFGIKLEKVYATDSELGYKITVDKDSDIRDAKVSLYKFDEESNKNSEEPVASYKLSDLTTSANGEYSNVSFTGLDSDTIYTAVLDEFSVMSTNFKDLYNITLTSMTLKKLPTFSEMTINKDSGNGIFKLALENISDPDNAIVGYTYRIYENSNQKDTAIEPITKTNASPIQVKIGNGENELKNDTNYFYRVVIEYYDNEKYIEYITSDSIVFSMGSDPFVTVVPDKEKISYNQIAATIYLTDNSCSISMPDREKCDGDNTTVLDVKKRDPYTGREESIAGYPRSIAFDVDGNIIKKDIIVDNLDHGTTYVIYVSAVRNDLLSAGLAQISNSAESENYIMTKFLATFEAEWKAGDSTTTHIINMDTQLKGRENDNAISSSETASIINRVVIRLYNGQYEGNLASQRLLVSKPFENTEDTTLKEMFYDNPYKITTDETFELDIDTLKQLTKNENGKLSPYYTLAIYAYYDINEQYSILIDKNIKDYRINKELLADEIKDPTITLVPIKKEENDAFPNLTVETTVGYKVTASFDKNGLISNDMNPVGINMYVYDAVTKEKVQFYQMDQAGNLTLTEKITADINDVGSYTDYIYMGYGTDYGTKDTIMSRGNSYYIGYEVVTQGEDNIKGLYPSNVIEELPVSYGYYELVKTDKDSPKINYLYVDKSTYNSVIYKYEIIDPDRAIYSTTNYNLYYSVNDDGEYEIDITDDIKEENPLTFTGDFTVGNLDKNDEDKLGYTLFYKVNINKTGNPSDDIKNKTIGLTNRLFEGYYDVTEEKYNFKYKVINNSLSDNKVVIKMLAKQELLDRIVSYRMNFKDSKGNVYDAPEEWQLKKCQDDGSYRCLSVDYIKLKNNGMKSDNQENLITVSVSAVYDNGLMGYSYTVGEGKDYPYMIMQNDSTKSKYGYYIIYTTSGTPINLTESLELAKGYYTYSKMTDAFGYYSEYNTSHVGSINYKLVSEGYKSASLGTLNPKMMSVSKMTSNENTFSFSSVTPTVAINQTTRLINGAKVKLQLTGADIDEFCEENTGDNCVNTSNGDKYIYIETWNDSALVGDLSQTIRPTLKVKINNSNTGEELVADIINLYNGKDYYYNVYAYLNKNNRKEYTQLFDNASADKGNGWETKTYEFKSKLLSEVFSSYTSNYKPSLTGGYNDKLLDTTINLTAYDNSVPFNFDVSYAFCQYDDENCGVGEDNTNIFKKVITADNVKATITDQVDISSYDLTYNKDYYMYIYVTYDYYDKDKNSVIKNTVPFYSNKVTATVHLNELLPPEFVVRKRKAVYVDGKYGIDLNIEVIDNTYRTLNDGKYHVKVVDSNGNIVGNLQIMNADETYTTVSTNSDYDSYDLDATVKGSSVRISGLTESTKYTVYIFGDADLKNEGDSQITKHIVKEYSMYTTNSFGVAFGQTVGYGITENSVVLSFPSGSNFDNIEIVEYLIEDLNGTDRHDGQYIIGDDKYFDIDTEADEWRFIIDPVDMNNILNHTYLITTRYYVNDKETGNARWFDFNDNDSFSRPVVYIKKKN